MTHDANHLITIFNHLFKDTENTILVGGAEEPLYLPGNPHQVIFTRDYFQSALHEIAHWCIAGSERRQLLDYGYWYYPEGRSVDQQLLFEKAEVKPQALECIFSMAAESRFVVSQDNFTTPGAYDSSRFPVMVEKQVQDYLANGLPERARIFRDALLR